MDNIDLAIFGSVVRLADTTTTTDSAGAVAPSSGSGVVLDVGSVFSGTLPPARLALPRFRPRANRGHVFDPTRLLSVDEAASSRERSHVFNCL